MEEALKGAFEPKGRQTEEIDNKKKKRSTYNKKRYEENKERILLYRKERYKLLNQKNTNIDIQCGEFMLSFD
jgi:hypothetical protein